MREVSETVAQSKHKKLAQTQTIKVTRRQVETARARLNADRL